VKPTAWITAGDAITAPLVRPVPLIPQVLGMAWRIVRSRRRLDGAALRTDNGNALDLVAAHHHERRLFVRAEGTGAKVERSHE
jgi:hypothetical protein